MCTQFGLIERRAGRAPISIPGQLIHCHELHNILDSSVVETKHRDPRLSDGCVFLLRWFPGACLAYRVSIVNNKGLKL